ncbi:ABC transporter ATP-binding protein [Pseudonocardia thermophila]|uniref:ABC transporter ATP-binding protein n=1 Tax=Pseudonocardia thermophila TaxID=1848 RepID=UPI00248E0FC2|nr:ABC transporter ATP-binding protein [Pseudonocardia thermophila]
MTGGTSVGGGVAVDERSPAAFEIDELTAGYEQAIVVRDASLAVPAGAVVALVGPNGAGKTTLLKSASGLITPRSGRVRLAGEDITSLTTHQRVEKGLCHVPEGSGVYPSLTVGENLRLQSMKSREAEGIERAVAVFPVLGRRMNQLAGTLSGGERKMLAMAAVYIRDPKLIVVDEPSFGLAPRIVEEIFTFLRGVAEKGASLLIVDQYVNQVLQLADHVYVMRQGLLTYVGRAASVDADDLAEQYFGTGSGTIHEDADGHRSSGGVRA